MHSLLIEHRVCPRCGNRRTSRLWPHRTSFCFNCHCRWDWAAGTPSRLAAQPPADPAQLGERAEQPYLFSPDDLARLRFVRWLHQTGRLHEQDTR
jgi:hypothetical protein